MEFVGLAGGFISISAALPQIYKCVLTQNTKDLSYATNVVSYIGSSMGVYYGFGIGHTTIVACNLYSILVNTALLSTKIYFEVVCSGSKDKYVYLDKPKNDGDYSAVL